MYKVAHSSHLELVEDYFDNKAHYWSDAYQKPQYVNDFVLVDRKNIAVGFLCTYVRPGVTILDAGCGAGLATLDLIQKGFFVHAADISQKMLELCKQNLDDRGILASSYLLTRCDVLEADLPASSFDGVMALGFLQYQVDEHEALKALNRLLKPGGILVLSGPVKIKLSEYFGLAKIYYAIRDGLRHSKPKPDISLLHEISRHGYSISRFKALLRKADFEVLDYKGHGFVNFAIIIDWTSRGQHFLHRFFTRLSKFLPIGQFANDLVVVARKNSES